MATARSERMPTQLIRPEMYDLSEPPTTSRQPEMWHQRTETQRRNLQSQLPSKLTGVPVRIEVKEYREKFDPARSGNGWIYKSIVDEWNVRCWVGQRHNKYCACVFSPSRKNDFGEWVEATDKPLERSVNTENEGFEHLYDLEQSGEIMRWAREAIEEYNALFSMPNSVRDDSMPDSGSEDDIPF